MAIQLFGPVANAWLLVGMLITFPIPLEAQTGVHALSGQMGRRIELAEATHQIQVDGETIRELDLVLALYEQASFQPLWGEAENVRTLMRWIERAWAEGLTPDDYHHRLLKQNLDPNSPLPEQKIDRDLLLSDALMQLILHLRTGKVDPKRLFREWNYEPDWTRFPTIAEILKALREGRIDHLLADQLPTALFYAGLREGLERYREILGQGGWQRISRGTTLHPGDQNERVVQLRKRLLMSGDLQTTPEGPPSDLYDLELEQAVRHFQYRHLLEVDGLVGRKTLLALNVPVEKKIQQIRINMERLRWLNHGIPDEFIAVDLAGFEIAHWLGEEITWSSAVQVGEPYW